MMKLTPAEHLTWSKLHMARLSKCGKEGRCTQVQDVACQSLFGIQSSPFSSDTCVLVVIHCVLKVGACSSWSIWEFL